MKQAGKNLRIPPVIPETGKTVISPPFIYENERFRARNRDFVYPACNHFCQLIVYLSRIYMDLSIVNKKGYQYHR